MVITMSTKCACVDGASFSNMKLALGINDVNYPALRRTLARIGTCDHFAPRPIMTVDPRYVTKRNRLLTELDHAGFTAIPIASEHEEDDLVIRKHIRSAASGTAEIVIVSADMGYMEALEEKAAQGIRIYWVATLAVHPDDQRCSLSKRVIERCKRPGFQFIDLARYKNFLAQNK